jgi:hypothetical protein
MEPINPFGQTILNQNSQDLLISMKMMISLTDLFNFHVPVLALVMEILDLFKNNPYLLSSDNLLSF